jgi:hypothetical protein
VPSLRYRPATLSWRGKDLSFEDRDAVEVVGDCAGSQEAGDAAPITTAWFVLSVMGPASCRPDLRSSGKSPYFEDKWRTA